MVFVTQLSEEMQKKAQKELKEVPERRDEDIQAIRDWLKRQPHLNARSDDWNILRFLRGCKFSLERTKEKMDMFYTCKALVPEWYLNRDPLNPKMKEILDLGGFLPLPGYDNDGRMVVIVRAGMHDPSKISMDEVFKANHLVYDVYACGDEQHTVTGVNQIIDLDGMTGAHALQMTPALVKKASTIWQDGYPMRPKGIHYINTPPSFDAVFNIFKAFMKEKMKKRVQIHGNSLESLHKAIPPSVLPKEYGGTNGTVEEIKNYWTERVISKRNWLIEDEQYKVDEKKRPGKPKTTSELFGIEGSFRKLTVD